MGVVIQLDGHPGYDEGLYLEIPAGTFHRDVYIIEGLGMPILKESGKYGDLHLTVEVSVSDEERSKMSKMGASRLQSILESHCRPLSPNYKESYQGNLKLKK